MSVGSCRSIVGSIGTHGVWEYVLVCQLEVSIVSGDLLARQLEYEYLFACQLEASVVQ